MLQFHRTSLLTSSAQTVVNTVNTVGVMGKGIAVAFKTRNPSMFNDYMKICASGDLDAGGLWLWKGTDQWVLNFATKKHWRNPSKMEYIQNGLQQFRRDYEHLGIREISFPRLGCGNGGLDWSEVRPLMVRELQDLPITIYIHDFEKPLGSTEHELAFQQVQQPRSFEKFYEDLHHLVEGRSGNFHAIFLNEPFMVSISEDGVLKALDSEEKVVASKEDLFRVWTLLSEMPISRFDLPYSASEHALELISVLAELPYARAVNLANKKGRNSLAVEFLRRTTSESVPLEGATAGG